MADRVIQRNDTAARWKEVNPVLAMGEIGIETDGAKGYKIGDGVTRWNDLAYPANPTSVVQEGGTSETAVMSQKAVSEKIGELKSLKSNVNNTPILSAVTYASTTNLLALKIKKHDAFWVKVNTNGEYGRVIVNYNNNTSNRLGDTDNSTTPLAINEWQSFIAKEDISVLGLYVSVNGEYSIEVIYPTIAKLWDDFDALQCSRKYNRDILRGKYIYIDANTGLFNYNKNYCVTDYIRVCNGNIIKFNSKIVSDNIAILAAWDKDWNYINDLSIRGGTTDIFYKVNSEVAYVRFTVPVNDDFNVEITSEYGGSNDNVLREEVFGQENSNSRKLSIELTEDNFFVENPFDGGEHITIEAKTSTNRWMIIAFAEKNEGFSNYIPNGNIMPLMQINNTVNNGNKTINVIAPSKNKYPYIGISSVASLSSVVMTWTDVTSSINSRLSKVEVNGYNHWRGKKVGLLGTSVAFGQYAEGVAYGKIAADRLDLDLRCFAVPGLALHCYNITYRDNNNIEKNIIAPLSGGSLMLSKGEYAAWNDVRSKLISGEYTYISGLPYDSFTIANATSSFAINDSPLYADWQPDGLTNKHYCAYDNVFTDKNRDIDLWIVNLVPNSRVFDETDWNLFNPNTGQYSDNSDVEQHRCTWLGAMISLLDKIHKLNPKAQVVLGIDGNYNLESGRKCSKLISNTFNIPFIDLYSKINTFPHNDNVDVLMSENGINNHPSSFAHQRMGNILTNELMFI